MPRPAGPLRASPRTRRTRSSRSVEGVSVRSRSRSDDRAMRWDGLVEWPHGRATISRGSGRVPVGPLVFKTSGAALGAARWVRLPRAPASDEVDADRASPSALPPEGRARRSAAEVAGLRRRPLGRRPGPSADRPSCRDVIAEERGRLAAGEVGPDGRDPCRGGRRPARGLRRSVRRKRPHVRHQRDRRHPAHEPRPCPVAPGGDRRGDAGGRRATRCSSSTATTGRRGPRFRAAEEHLIALTGAEDALVTENNAAALALAVGLAGQTRGRGVARRARRDRWRRPDPGDRPANRRAAGRGRDDQPHASVGLRSAARRGPGDRRPSGPSRRTSRRPASWRRPTRSRSRGSPTRTARSSSMTSAAGRCSTRRPSGSPTSRLPPSGWRPGGPRDVQRRQAGRWPAGRADRRAGRPHRPDPA